MIENTPKVSVLMPVYNGEKYLQQAIDSILGQTYSNFSLVIIDDGSTDSSREIIDSYTDNRIELIQNKKNKGLIFSLNKGLDRCDGDYVARMDCDDFSLPDRIEKQVAFMESNPQVGVCGSWFSVYNEDFTENLYTVKLPDDPEVLRTMLFTNSCMCHPATMFRMSYFRQYNLRYDPINKHAEDFGLWMECSKYFQFSNLPEVLLHYRSTPTGICHMHGAEQKKTTCRILEHNLKLIGLSNLDEDFLQFHFRMVYGSEKLKSADRGMLVKWYNTLIAANTATGYYDEDIFISLLGTKVRNISM